MRDYNRSLAFPVLPAASFPLSCYYLVAVAITSVLFLYDTDLVGMDQLSTMYVAELSQM